VDRHLRVAEQWRHRDLIVSGVTINDKRKQSYAFTSPYFEARQLIAVPASSTVKTLKDLTGKKVGVVIGSAGDDIASAAFGKTSSNIRRFESTPVMIQELAASGLDAAIGDNGVIAYRVQEQKRLKTVDDPAFPKEYFGIVVKLGNTALLGKLSAGLAAVKGDGTYATLASGSRPNRRRCPRTRHVPATHGAGADILVRGFRADIIGSTRSCSGADWDDDRDHRDLHRARDGARPVVGIARG
jgi:hypothetical protein